MSFKQINTTIMENPTSTPEVEPEDSKTPAQEEKLISSKERKMQHLEHEGDDADTEENQYRVKFRGYR